MDQVYAEWLTMAVQIVLMVALGYVTLWARRRWSAEQIALAATIAREAVLAVEQVARTAGWRSPTKKFEALAKAKLLAVKNGLRLSDEQWDALIEAAVIQFGNAYRDATTAKRPQE